MQEGLYALQKVEEEKRRLEQLLEDQTTQVLSLRAYWYTGTNTDSAARTTSRGPNHAGEQEVLKYL